MKCDVYPAKKSATTFLVVSQDMELSQLKKNVREEFNTEKPWKSIDISTENSLIGLDSEEALSSIRNQGYYITSPKIVVDEKGL